MSGEARVVCPACKDAMARRFERSHASLCAYMASVESTVVEDLLDDLFPDRHLDGAS